MTTKLAPIRCFTCGKVLGRVRAKMADGGDQMRQELEQLNLRFCCRRALLSFETPELA